MEWLTLGLIGATLAVAGVGAWIAVQVENRTLVASAADLRVKGQQTAEVFLHHLKVRYWGLDRAKAHGHELKPYIHLSDLNVSANDAVAMQEVGAVEAQGTLNDLSDECHLVFGQFKRGRPPRKGKHHPKNWPLTAADRRGIERAIELLINAQRELLPVVPAQAT